MHGIVAAVLAADGVEATGIAGCRVKCVVLALTVGVPDGVDRGEIKYVEAHAGDVRQTRNAVVECAMPARFRALAAWDHLVPGAGARPRAVGDKWHDMAAGKVRARLNLFHRGRHR